MICFFIISGYLFHYRPERATDFFKKKIKVLVVPWLISATLVYFYVYLRKPPINFIGWLNFVVGNGSYCYYMTVLLALYIIFYFFPCMRTNGALIICILISVISSIWFYQWGDFTPYLNVLNWIGFFSLGLFLQTNLKFKNKVLTILKQTKLLWVMLASFFIGVQVFLGSGGWYWKGLNAVSTWIIAITFVVISFMLSTRKCSRVVEIIKIIGEDSFFIYIYHMPIAGMIANLMSRGELVWFVLVRPLIVLLIVEMFVIVVKKVLLNTSLKKFTSYIGIKL